MRTVAEISRTCRITMYSTACTHAVEASRLDHTWLGEDWGEFAFADTPFLMSSLAFIQAPWNLPKPLLYLYSNPFCPPVFLFSFVFSKKRICNLEIEKREMCLVGLWYMDPLFKIPLLGLGFRNLGLVFILSVVGQKHTQRKDFFFHLLKQYSLQYFKRLNNKPIPLSRDVLKVPLYGILSVSRHQTPGHQLMSSSGYVLLVHYVMWLLSFLPGIGQLCCLSTLKKICFPSIYMCTLLS